MCLAFCIYLQVDMVNMLIIEFSLMKQFIREKD